MGGGHNDAGVKICENQLGFDLYIRKIAGGRGAVPDPVVVCLYF